MKRKSNQIHHASQRNAAELATVAGGEPNVEQNITDNRVFLLGDAGSVNVDKTQFIGNQQTKITNLGLNFSFLGIG